MDDKNKQTLIKYLISFGICLLVSFLLFIVFGGFQELETLGIFLRLSDATFSCGVLLMCGVAIIWLSREGAFNGIKYGVSKLGQSRTRRDLKNYHQTYGDYCMEQQEKRKRTSLLYLIIPAIVMILLGAIFYLLVMNQIES